MRLSEASSSYLLQLEQERYSPCTVKAYRIQLNLLARDLDDMEIDVVTLQHLREHLSHHGHLKPSSMAHKVKSVRNLFRWLVEEEYLVRNPSLKLKEPKQGERVPKALTVDEIEELREACQSPLEHALLEFFFATGCRLSEVQSLNRNAIDWNRKAVVVMGKGSKEREVYFGAKAAVWMRRYLNVRKDADMALFVTVNKPHRIGIHRIQCIFKQIAERCGLAEKVSPHKFRHSLATTLLNQGAPIAAVQSLLGHSKPETTQVYAKLSGASRQQAYNRYFVQ